MAELLKKILTPHQMKQKFEKGKVDVATLMTSQ
jgi:hypothetical protein